MGTIIVNSQVSAQETNMFRLLVYLKMIQEMQEIKSVCKEIAGKHG